MKTLSEPKPNLSKKKIKEIKKYFSELRYEFSKSKINEFRGSLYNIKNPKISSHTRNRRLKIILLNQKKVFLGLRSIMIMIKSNTEEQET